MVVLKVMQEAEIRNSVNYLDHCSFDICMTVKKENCLRNNK